MKKQVIALVLSAVLSVCSIGAVPVFAVESAEEGSATTEMNTNGQEESVEESEADTNWTSEAASEEKTRESVENDTENAAEMTTDEDKSLDEQDNLVEENVNPEEQDESENSSATVGATDDEKEATDSAYKGDTSEEISDNDELISIEEEVETAEENKPVLAGNGSVAASGSCGSDVAWKITNESEYYTLIIEGSGRINGFTSSSAVPWNAYMGSIKSVIIQDGITNVGAYMLYMASNLESVSIPNSVTSIESNAFYYCKNLRSIIIPDSVTTIGDNAFGTCEELESVTFSSNLESIGIGAFSYSGIVNATFGDKTITFGKSAFSHCSNLETVSFAGDRAQVLSDRCFEYCAKLRDFTITKYTSSLPEKIFYYCNNLKDIILPVNTKIYKAFGYSGLTDVYFEGTREQWNVKPIEYENSNDPLRSAKIHYGTDGAEITGLFFDPAIVEIDEGELIDISKNLEPWTAIEKGVSYESSDSTVATVDRYGVVKGKKGGTVTVSVQLDDTDYTAVCKIVVRGKVNEIQFDKYEIHLAKGRYDTINALVLPEDAYDKTLTWKSSKTSVATVNTKGIVNAVGLGEAVITAVDRYNNVSQSCVVKVYTPIDSLSLNNTRLQMKSGESASLVATAKPSSGIYGVFDWESSDETVAKVDSEGNVSAVGAGAAVITCTAKDGTEEYASCSIEVTEPVKSVELTEEKTDIQRGRTKKINYSILPENASNKDVVWNSSDESVATVDSNGNIKALKIGSTIISCTSVDNPEAIAECTVNVIVPITGLSFSETSVKLNRGEKKALSPVPSPADTTDKEYLWESGDENVATVDGSGSVTAINAGTTIIRCTSKNNSDIWAECSIEVFVPMTGIELSKTAITLLRGASETITVRILPEDTTTKEVTWSSSNERVATVDHNGKISAANGGTAVITCSSKETPEIKAECTVNVEVPIEKIELNSSELSVYKGDSVSLTVSLRPLDTTETNLIWNSSNSKVASVDETGMVVALGKGTTVIRCRSKENASVYAECKINVDVQVESISLSRESLTLFRGNQFKLTATVEPVDASEETFTWKSSDENVATVDENGMISTNTVGVTNITCASKKNPSVRKSCKVTVVDMIDTADILNVQDKVYTGAEITQNPSVLMKNSAGTVLLIKDTDYTVSYSNNINAGIATITITGIGSYIGTATKTFTILPGKTTRGDMFNLANNVKVTWKEVPGAKYYKVYRSGIKDPVIVTAGLVGWDKEPGLVNGQKYTYKIVASLTGKGDPGGDSPLSYSKVMYRLKTVVIRSVKNTGPGKVTIKYDKTTSGDSYVLQYCEREDMVGAKTKVVLGASNTSYTIGGLKKGKTYYISIRVRKKVNGIDYYTTFGVPKKVTITK